MSASQRADRITRLSGIVMLRNEKHVFKIREDKDLGKPCKERSLAINMCESQTGEGDLIGKRQKATRVMYVHCCEHVFDKFRAAKDRFQCKEIGGNVF